MNYDDLKRQQVNARFAGRCELEAKQIERERNPTAEQILAELTAAEKARMKL